MLSWTTWSILTLGLLGIWLLISYVSQKVKQKLLKAGVTLSYRSLSLSSISGVQLQLTKGPVQSLTIDCITWGASTQRSNSQGGSNSDGGHAEAAAAWLPINIRGVTLVISKAAAAGSKRKQKASKHHAARNPAAAAAARPAVSSVLAVARRLLPGVPITLQDATVKLKDQGLSLHVRKAGLQWTSDAPVSTLWSALLLHDVSMSPGATACAEGPDGPASFHCPVAQVSAGLVPGRGPVPISCTELRVQVGATKLYGLSQLLLLAAAAKQPRPPQHARPSAQGAPAGAQGAAGTQAVDGDRQHSKAPARSVLLAVAAMPEKVKVSIAGAQLLPCRQLPEERTSLLQLPLVLGSVSAITLAASSSQKPSEVKLGSKLLSMSLTVGQVEVSAAGPPSAGSRGADAAASSASSRNKGAAAAVFVLPGITGSGHLANMPGAGSPSSSSSSSRATSWAGRSSSSGLRFRQQLGSEQTQAQQQHEEGAQQQQPQQTGQQKVLKATCTCQLKQQTQLQLHAARLPALLRAVQLLQVSLQELKAEQQAAAGGLAARQSDDSSSDEQLPENSLSPAVSLSSFPREETPSLSTPCMSPSPRPTTELDATAAAAAAPASAATAQGSSSADAAAGAAAAVPGSSDKGGRLRGLATFRSGMLQRLPSRLLFIGGGADTQHADVGLKGELSVVTEAGVSVEVTDSRGEVSCWLSVQEIDAGAVAEWVPDVRSSSSSRRSLLLTRRQQQAQWMLQLSAHALLQQLCISVAPCAAQDAAAAAAAGKSSQGRLPLHKLLQLDSASLQVSSSEAEQSNPPAAAEAAAALSEKQPLPLQLSALAGQLQVAASVAALQPLLALAEQLYQPTKQQTSSAGALPHSSSCTGAATPEQLSELSVFEVAAAAAAGPLSQQKKPKVKRVVITAVEVQLQGCEVALTHSLCTSTLSTDAAKQAAAAGLQTQLLLLVSGVQLSVLPCQQQLGASLEVLQVGYKTQTAGAAAVGSAQQQSVELLLLQAVQMRQYHADNLHLLKVAVQQIRSDNHIDAVLAGANLASAVLQQGLSCVQQLGLRHASAGAATAAQQAAAAAVAAAAAGDVQAAQEAAGVATAAAAALDEQGLYRGDSFSALAVQLILDSLGAGQGAGASADTDTSKAAQQQLSGPSAGAGLPPAAVRPGSSGDSARMAPRQLKQKPLLALEARLCDIAVQLSVCDNDALMVQLQQVNYSSVLEQAVITDLRFAINDRMVVRVPHAAVHDMPGWLPPGATAAAAGQARWPGSFSDTGGGVAAANVSSDDGQGVSAAAPQDGSDAAAAGEGWQDHAVAEAGDMTGTSFLSSPAPCSSLGSRRPLSSADSALYSRQTARQAAGRERCKAPANAAASTDARSAAAADASGSAAAAARVGRSSISFSRSNNAAKAAAGGSDDTRAGAAGNEVISLDVYAERVLLSIPHDEAPGRIIVVCETWAKAVKEVLKPQLTAVKATVGALKAGLAALKASSSSSSAKAAKVKPPKPAYLELLVNLQELVFSLEQNPLETWMGLHGPLLQSMAAERHLTEQLLASCASAHGRISRSGRSGVAGPEGTVAGRGRGRQASSGRTQAKQWQSRRWGAIGKKGTNAVLAGIAAGSVTEAAGAAAAEAVTAAGPLLSGLASFHAAVTYPPGHPAHGAGSTAGAPSETAAGPLTPAAADTGVAPGAAGSSSEAPADGSDGETPGGYVSADESSEDTDSSDGGGHLELADPDALAAAMPSSASDLAQMDRQGGSGRFDQTALGQTGAAPAAAGAGAAAAGAAAAAAAAAAAVPTDAAAAAAVLSAVAATGEAGNGHTEMAQAILEAHRELFDMYRFRCRPLDAAAEDPYHHSRAVMHVSCCRAEAVVLICLPGKAAADVMATEVIRRVDPPSEGVEFARTQSISIDFSGHDVVAHFGGVEEMASTIGSIQASGLLVRARQVCAAPQTRPMRMAVGQWHAADVPVVVKGTHPPMKMYTDIKAELEDVQGAFCPGLEAPFGQLNIAFKRLVTPNALNPDGTVPPSIHPGLPWWDMMRYMWRGVASVRVRNLTAVLANTLNPHVRPRDERLALTAATLSVSMAAGRIDMTTTSITAHAHALPPDSSLGDAMLVLPAFHLPLANLTFNITTKLPGGRSPLFHHVFPILSRAPPPDSPSQDIVDVFSLMKCEGWSLGIDIAVNSDKTATYARGGGAAAAAGVSGSGVVPGSAAGVPFGAAGSCWHYYQPFSLPHAFIGEFQIKYIIDMVDGFVNAHPVVRYSRKLKPYYVRDRRPEAAEAARAVAAVRASIVQMPLLKQRIEINLTADVFRVHHDAQDADDPSDMAFIALSSVRYSNTFTYSRYKRTLQLSNGPRLKDSMRQFMASLSVEAYDLKVIKPQADEPLSSMLASSQWGTGPVCSSPGPWGAEQQQGGGGSAAGMSGQQASTSFRRAGVAQDLPQKLAAEPRTPPRSAVASAAAAGSTAGPGSPRSGPSATKSPLVHGRTATGPGSSSRRAADAAAGTADGAEDADMPGFGQGLIAAAACFLLRQAPPEVSSAASAAAGAASGPLAAADGQILVDPPPMPKRPIRMIAQDVKLLCPAELRDTCMLLFHHMQKAFSGIQFGQPKGPVRISTKQQQRQQAADGGSNSGGSSPRINRSLSDGMQSSGSLAKSSLGSGANALRRHGSSDAAPTSEPLGNIGPAIECINCVSTPAEEDRMLQTILAQNAASAAAAAAAERKRAAARARELQTRSGSAGGVSVGASDSFVSSIDGSISAAAGAVAGAPQGSGHIAAAVRAFKGVTTGATAGSVGPDGDEGLQGSPHSAAMSDLSLATDSSAVHSAAGVSGAAAEAQGVQGGGGSSGGLGVVEQLLLEYEIEFVQVQVNLVSDSARGSLVLGTNSALLMGHVNTARLERSVSFKMDQVQAHVVCSEMDTQRGLLWLQIANGKLSTPSGAEGIMRQVLLPFKCQLVTTKQAQNSATAAALNAAATTAASSAGPMSAAGSTPNLQQQLQHPGQRGAQQATGFAGVGGSTGGVQAGAVVPAGNAAQELRLHVPTIGARLDSRQFEVLMDVIQNIAMAPLPTFPPTVKGMWAHPDGTSEDDDNQDVQYALETLQSLRERQRCLEQELLSVLASQQQYAAWQSPHTSQQYTIGLLPPQQQQQALALPSGTSGMRQGGAVQQQQLQPYSVSTHAASSVTWNNDAVPPSAGGDNESLAPSYYTGSISAPTAAGSVVWQQQDRRSPTSAGAYTDIKEASIALVLALAEAGTAAERQQQLMSTALSQQHLQQLMKGAHTAPSSSAGTLSCISGSTAAAGGRGLHAAKPLGSCTNLTALQQQEQLVLVAERPTVVWWAQEQLQGALDAITASRTVLEMLRSEAGLLKVRQRNAMGVDITVDTIDWALSKGSTVIVQGELQGISYQSIRSEDHTGTTKIQMHTATFRDPQQQQQAAAAAATAAAAAAANKSAYAAHAEATLADAAGAVDAAAGSSGPLPHLQQCSTPRELAAAASAGYSAQQALDAAAAAAAAAAAEAGLILAPWNPDESWEADELVRIYAIHGAMEARHVVYEHIEVLVHPIRVHLTAALAGALQDYFNLRDEEGTKESKPAGRAQEAAAVRAAKQAAREDKRRLTAPGDLTSGPSATSLSGAPGPSGPSASSPVGPLTAAVRKPSIFHRRAAAAAAAAAASAGSVSAQPLIAVPSSEYEVSGIHGTEGGARSVASTPTVDSPAPEHYSVLPPPVLASGLGVAGGPGVDSVGLHMPASTAPGGGSVIDLNAAAAAASASNRDDAASWVSMAPSSAAAMATAAADAAAADADLAPVLLYQGTACDWSVVLPLEALGLRYGTVKRSRLGRVGISIPYPGTSMVAITPSAAASGAAAGAPMGMGVPGAGPGPGASTPGVAAAAAAGGGTSGAGAARSRAPPVRSIKFKHVRFNRMHARLTYEGPALSIRNFGLVLDNRVYRNIDGGWKTVLNRYKWDVVRSLLKSATGLQARKLQELQIPNYGTDPPDTLELRSSAGFKAGIMSLLKGRKGRGAKLKLGGAGGAAEGGLSDDLEGLSAGSAVGELGGEEGGGVGDVDGADAAAGPGADYLELMRSALRLKHKQRKMQLLLGHVPPLPHQAGAAAVQG